MSEENIILRKTVYKEKDLILTMLNKNGNKYSLYVYGGHSSSKRSHLEIGHAVNATLSVSSTKHKGMRSLKESKLKWHYENIRNHYKAFYLMTFFLEVIEKVATPIDDDDMKINDLYLILANSLFYLEKEYYKSDQLRENMMTIFLVKLIHELGISPSLSHCSLCSEPLESFVFDSSSEGFQCTKCVDRSQKEEVDLAQTLHQIFGLILSQKYSELAGFTLSSKQEVRLLLQFLCTRYNYNLSDFRSLSSIL